MINFIMNKQNQEDLNINKVIFRPYRPWLNKNSISAPSTTHSVMPEWYKTADRFAKMPNGEYFKATKAHCPVAKEGTKDDYGKIPTWKACPAIKDGFSTGYVLKTPTELKFFKDSMGKIDVKVSDSRHKDFIQKRTPMQQFEHPMGYYKEHFAWWSPWSLELPKGYSALFVTPMNRFDLPFINTTGIIDSDNVTEMGTLPFFIVDGWEGTLPEGTPFVQIIPFKRENWESSIDQITPNEMMKRQVENSAKYRQPDGGVYIKNVWTRREYK